jgi:hypothetical protein
MRITQGPASGDFGGLDGLLSPFSPCRCPNDGLLTASLVGDTYARTRNVTLNG